jgi:hypothetical protein
LQIFKMGSVLLEIWFDEWSYSSKDIVHVFVSNDEEYDSCFEMTHHCKPSLCSDGSEVLIIEQCCTDYFTYSHKRRLHDIVNFENMFEKI